MNKIFHIVVVFIHSLRGRVVDEIFNATGTDEVNYISVVASAELTTRI